MSNPTPSNINSILAALASQNGSATPVAAAALPMHHQPGPPSTPESYRQAHPHHAPYPPPPALAAQQAYPAPRNYSYPVPSTSGSLDLTTVKPVTSGTVTMMADPLAQANAYAESNGLPPYERLPPPPAYPPADHMHPADMLRYGRSSRSRSRSPLPRRDTRDVSSSYNVFRDERCDDRGGSCTRDRSRSRSPGPRGRHPYSPRPGPPGPVRERSPMRGAGPDGNCEVIHIESNLVGLIIGRQGENLRRVENESHCRVQFVPGEKGDRHRACRISGVRSRREQAKDMIYRIIDDSGMAAIVRAGWDRQQTARTDLTRSGHASLRDGEDCLRIMVPDRTVGLIIGCGGETIRDLQERSGCHVNIVGKDQSVDGLRPVNLIGPHDAAMLAKDLIMEIVDSDSRNGGSGPHLGGGSRRGYSRHDGLGGDDAPGAGGGPGPYGHGGGAGPAGPGGLRGADRMHDSMSVPSEAVGMIIGKGGETIREMQNQTGCKINVTQQSGPGEAEREVGLVGTREAIDRARRAIEEKVDAVRQKNSGDGRGRGHHGDYDNPNPVQSNRHQHRNNGYSNNGGENVPVSQVDHHRPGPAGGDNGHGDPYAMYGGFQNYAALWAMYHHSTQTQQAQQPTQ